MDDNEDHEQELSAEETEKLLLFQNLTGIEDMQRCRRILDQHNFNIEAAVQDTLNESEGRPTVYHQPPPQPPPVNERLPEVVDNHATQRVYALSHRYPQTWVEWGFMLIFFPFRLVYSTVFDIFRSIWGFFRLDPRRNVVDPIGDVRKFIVSYNEKYSEVHPNFFEGSYSQALNEAKRELKFLLVYLHGDDHQDTEKFCRSTLANAEFIEFVNSRMLFWGASVNTPEGYRVSQAMRESTYPFLALVVLRHAKMTVVLRVEGSIEAQDLMTRLTRVMNDTEGHLIAARQAKEERSLANTLRQQQDQAYQESLRQDQEKARKRREEEAKKQREEQERMEEEQQRQRRKEEKIQLRINKAANMPAEPAVDDPDSLQLLLKLPNGVRLERRFRKGDSLEMIYDFVFVQNDVPEEYQILTNYPRRVLHCQRASENDTIPTIAESGLQQREILFVQDISD